MEWEQLKIREKEGKQVVNLIDKTVVKLSEQNRRAHLRECFGSLNNLLPSRENRRQSNHSILLGTISHIKELERTHALFCKERDKEKFQQRSLQNRLNHILNGTDSLENLRQEDLSSPSTDTASDVSDEGDVLRGTIEPCQTTTTALLTTPSDSVPTQCPDVTSTAHPSSAFLLCPVLDQKIPHIQGTVFIQAPINFTQPFKPPDSTAGALTSATSAALSGLLPASLVSANPVSPAVSKLLPSTQTYQQPPSDQLKNLGQRPMVAWIPSEVIPATSQPGNNPRMAVQMLQQTLAQRAIEQQKKQNQMLGHSQPIAPVAQDKGSSGLKTGKLLQPATIAPQFHSSVALLSSLSAPSSLSSSPAYKMSSSTAVAMNESRMYPEVRVVTTIPQLVVSTSSLRGASFASGTSPIFSTLQLLSSNQISGLHTRSVNDLAQLGIQQTSIPVIQFMNSVSVGSPNIPILSNDSTYHQQVVASVVSTPVMMSSSEHPSNQAMIIAAVPENILPVSCPSTQL